MTFAMTLSTSSVTLMVTFLYIMLSCHPGGNSGVNAGMIIPGSTPRVAQFASREVYQGEGTELTCTVAGSGSLSVCWHVASDRAASTASRYISYCADPEKSSDDSDDGRHEIMVDKKRGVYNLKIDPVLQEDSGLYMCAILNPSGIALLFGSGRLSVRTPVAPTAGPTCQFSIRNPVLNEGEMASTTCFAASGGEPMPSLQWMMNGDNGAYPLSQITAAQANQISWEVGANDDGAMYTCVERHIAMDVPRNCTIGPLQVAYSPIMTLGADPQRPKIGQNVTVTCEAYGNPPISHINWYIDDVAIHTIDMIQYRIDTFVNGAKKNESRLTLFNFKEEQYNTTIACVADNPQGSRNATIVLTPPPPRPPSNAGGGGYDHLRTIIILDLVALSAIVFFSVCVLGCWNNWRTLSEKIRSACACNRGGSPVHIPL